MFQVPRAELVQRDDAKDQGSRHCPTPARVKVGKAVQRFERRGRGTRDLQASILLVARKAARKNQCSAGRSGATAGPRNARRSSDASSRYVDERTRCSASLLRPQRVMPNGLYTASAVATTRTNSARAESANI